MTKPKAQSPGRFQVQADTMRTIDHLIPLARGGDEGRHNTVLACMRCNTLKADMTEASAEAWHRLQTLP